MEFSVRFWNEADENIKVFGQYRHEFATFADAWNAANAMLEAAYRLGAVSMDINNDYWPIEDEEVV